MGRGPAACPGLLGCSHTECSNIGLCRRGAGDATAAGFTAVAAEVSPSQLRSNLSFPPTFGPTEFGPIPFLPDPDLLVQRMEAAWGDLERYRGISTSAQGMCPAAHALCPVPRSCRVPCTLPPMGL